MSDAAYVNVLSRPILQRKGVTYLSCRAPDGTFVLLAHCQDDSLEQVIQRIRQKEVSFLEEIGVSAAHCSVKLCDKQRVCSRMSFLPRIFREGKLSYTYRLKYSCFEFSRMVRMKDLADKYYVSPLTTYRIAASMLTLIDWLIRMNVSMRLSISNLLIDLKSAFVIPIDWSIAKTPSFLPMRAIILYYRNFARIIMRLTGVKMVERVTNDKTKIGWELPTEFADSSFYDFFFLLQELLDQRYDLPDNLDRAIDYVAEIREKQQNLLKRIMETMQYDQVETKEPLYKLLSKNKIKEG